MMQFHTSVAGLAVLVLSIPDPLSCNHRMMLQNSAILVLCKEMSQGYQRSCCTLLTLCSCAIFQFSCITAACMHA